MASLSDFCDFTLFGKSPPAHFFENYVLEDTVMTKQLADGNLSVIKIDKGF
jgi:hypothetical protein